MRDISYCVGVVNSTFSISATLHSECGITETEYEYPIPPDSACHDHMVTVTPVNAAGSGTASHIHYSQILKCMYLLAYYTYKAIGRVWAKGYIMAPPLFASYLVMLVE